MPAAPTVLWFRQDLRLQDNPALHAAIARGEPVVLVYILDDAGEARHPPGAASRWWLHHSLAALDLSLRKRGSRLVLAGGESANVLRELIRETKAGAVYWNTRYEPAAVARDASIARELVAAGVETRAFNASLLHEPEAIANRQGRPYRVFTAYWRHCLGVPVKPPVKLGPDPLPAIAPANRPRSLMLDELELLSRARAGADFGSAWQPGETGATRRLREFIANGIDDYANKRDLPAIDGTSRLSPHLHFGEIGPRQVWAAVRALGASAGVFPPGKGAAVFLREIGWREFAYHLLFHFPHSTERPLREEFARFPWAEDPGETNLHAWRRGLTGYPIVDAGMRQLSSMGWMHNRVRMIAASFLVKHLRLPWTAGAAWFENELVDADLACNTLGWQWSAGSGADATPYFRIFAPVLQGRKFDAAGDYVRRWVPELAKMPASFIHAPWEAPEEILRGAGVRPGIDYPQPIVDHAIARKQALTAFQHMRDAAQLSIQS